MGIASVSVRAAVQGTACSRIRLGIAPSRQNECNGGDDAYHEDHTSYADSNGEVTLGNADL